jgi:hypothetical protein
VERRHSRHRVAGRFGSLIRALIGPAYVEVAAQESILIGSSLVEPEILGIIPQIADAKELNGDDACGVDTGIVNPRVNRFIGPFGT